MTRIRTDVTEAMGRAIESHPAHVTELTTTTGIAAALRMLATRLEESPAGRFIAPTMLRVDLVVTALADRDDQVATVDQLAYDLMDEQGRPYAHLHAAVGAPVPGTVVTVAAPITAPAWM